MVQQYTNTQHLVQILLKLSTESIREAKSSSINQTPWSNKGHTYKLHWRDVIPKLWKLQDCAKGRCSLLQYDALVGVATFIGQLQGMNIFDHFDPTGRPGHHLTPTSLDSWHVVAGLNLACERRMHASPNIHLPFSDTLQVHQTSRERRLPSPYQAWQSCHHKPPTPRKPWMGLC
jgi:hypothetical protein